MPRLSSYTVADVGPDTSGDIQVDIRIRADMEASGPQGYTAAKSLIHAELAKLDGYLNEVGNIKTIGDYFESCFPTIISDLDVAASQNMWDCELDSAVGDAAKRAIDKAQELAALIYDGHGSYAETHHRAELVAIARMAFDLAGLYYYG